MAPSGGFPVNLWFLTKHFSPEMKMMFDVKGTFPSSKESGSE